MKKFCFLLAVSFVMQASTWAWWGGPFGNGTPAQTNDGTYTSILRGTNLVGVAIFGSGTSSTTTGGTVASTDGRCAIFIRGEMAQGIASGASDVNARMIVGMFEASKTRSGEQTVTFNVTDGQGQTIASTYDINDVLYFNGSFVGNITETFPLVRFEGKGEAELRQIDRINTFNPVLSSEFVRFRIDGTRISSTVLAFPTAPVVEIPYMVLTDYTGPIIP